MCEKVRIFKHIVSEYTSLPESLIEAGLDPSEDLIGADLSKMSLIGADLSGFNLSGANLSEADLRSAFLDRTNLNGANLSNARLERARLRGVVLSNALLYRASLVHTSLRIANLSNANLELAQLEGVDLRGANLTDVNLHQARIGRGDFRGAQLTRAILTEANLRCADLRHAYMGGANLRQCKLDGADMSNTNLAGADLSGASMQRVHGDGCNLSGANLATADLRSANFSAANFSSIQLQDTLVSRTFFLGSKGFSNLQQEDLKQRGAVFFEDPLRQIGFTHSDLENRISELKESIEKLSDWANNLNLKAVGEMARLAVGSKSPKHIAQAQVLLDLANEIQSTCKKDREFIDAYQKERQKFSQSPEELIQEYDNINEQIVKIGNFIRVVQAILVDIPGFIERHP
jgi:uncharacterized protein YjbI with pentapeptide repeats